MHARVFFANSRADLRAPEPSAKNLAAKSPRSSPIECILNGNQGGAVAAAPAQATTS